MSRYSSNTTVRPHCVKGHQCKGIPHTKDERPPLPGTQTREVGSRNCTISSSLSSSLELRVDGSGRGYRGGGGGLYRPFFRNRQRFQRNATLNACVNESFRHRFVNVKRLLPTRGNDNRNYHRQIANSGNIHRQCLKHLLRKGRSQDRRVTTIHSADRSGRFRIVFDRRGPTFILRISTQMTRGATSNRRLLVICLRSITTTRKFTRCLFNVRPLTRVSIRCLRLPLHVKRHIRGAISNSTTYFATLHRETRACNAHIRYRALRFINGKGIIPNRTFFCLVTQRTRNVRHRLRHSHKMERTLGLHTRPLPNRRVRGLIPVHVNACNASRATIRAGLQYVMDGIYQDATCLLSFKRTIPRDLTRACCCLVRGVVLFGR